MSSEMNGVDGPASLLALVIDLPPHLMLLECGPHHYFDSILAFANMHLGASVNRKLCIVSATHLSTEFLYPHQSDDNQKIRQKDGRLEQLLSLDECVETRLKAQMAAEQQQQQQLMNGHTNGSTAAAGPAESLLSGAMGRALLFIRRHVGSSKAAANTARMLVIKVAGEGIGQYLNYINVYLTAQKLGVPIDVCCITSDCGLLQQGADITGGYYHKLADPRALLQTLIILFSLGSWGGGGKGGGMVSLPPPDTVDYRAACFCHRALVNMANVCSNCLSVYCKAVPLCSTCNVFFPIEMPMKRLNKKKR